MYTTMQVPYCQRVLYSVLVYVRDEDDTDGEWEKFEYKSHNSPPPRAFAYFECSNVTNACYLYGGTRYNNAFTIFSVYDDLWEYNMDHMKWKRIHPKNSGPGPRVGAHGSIRNGRLVMFGGLDQFTRSYNDVWEFNLSTKRWTLLDANDPLVNSTDSYKPAGRYLAKVEVMGDLLLVFQGNFNPSALGVQWQDFWAFDLVLASSALLF